MIAVDTSSLRRYLTGASGQDVDVVATSLEQHQMVIPLVVLTEILSEPHLEEATIEALSAIPTLELLDGYWLRAGRLRAKMIAAGRKARVADALIAQSCLDHDVPLITNDGDFRHYERHGLILA
jgi:predicted nucleic acid-binding protein